MTTIKPSDIPVFENDLLAYIQKNLQTTERRPPGFGITLNEYAEKTGIPKTTARNRLKELMAAGKLKKKPMIWQGHEQKIYYADGES